MREVLTPPNPETLIEDGTVARLQTMTDLVLGKLGFSPAEIDLAVFHFTLPASFNERYGLTVYSINDGYPGFNTSAHSDTDDHSRRWSVHIDRGTNFGAAFDTKGTVYQSGKFDPSPFPYRQNINTGSISELISKFFDHANDSVTVEIPLVDNWQEKLTLQSSLRYPVKTESENQKGKLRVADKLAKMLGFRRQPD